MKIKPKQLKRGDTIGIISPSWGGPNTFPHIYSRGIEVIEGVRIQNKRISTY